MRLSKWDKMGTPNGPIQQVAFSSNGDLYALLFAGLARSTDGGRTWTKITVDFPDDYKIPTCMLVTDDGILVGAKANGSGSVILRSADGGKTWSHTKFAPKGGIKELPYEIESLADGSNGDLWAGADLGSLFRSTDKGRTWEAVGKIEVYETVAALAFDVDGQVFAAVAKTGIFRSKDNGRTWSETGYGKNSVDSVVINKKGHIFAGTMKRGVLRSDDGGKTWTSINDGLPSLEIPALALDKDDYLYGGTATSGIFRSTTSTR